MSEEIRNIPLEELLNDLFETIEDISVCTEALRLGVTEYSGGLVQERLNGNRKIQAVITTELVRRGVIIGVINSGCDLSEQQDDRASSNDVQSLSSSE